MHSTAKEPMKRQRPKKHRDEDFITKSERKKQRKQKHQQKSDC
jgi:hypothetical protein